MKVFVFGNEEDERDNLAITVAKNLTGKIKGLDFVEARTDAELSFLGQGKVVLMDAVEGIGKAEVLEKDRLGELVLPPRTSVHDFDLGFQLKYLEKIGRLGEVRVVGLPMDREVDYPRIKSILRKLVAQDMQGS